MKAIFNTQYFFTSSLILDITGEILELNDGDDNNNDRQHKGLCRSQSEFIELEGRFIDQIRNGCCCKVRSALGHQIYGDKYLEGRNHPGYEQIERSWLQEGPRNFAELCPSARMVDIRGLIQRLRYAPIAARYRIMPAPCDPSQFIRMSEKRAVPD